MCGVGISGCRHVVTLAFMVTCHSPGPWLTAYKHHVCNLPICSRGLLQVCRLWAACWYVSRLHVAASGLSTQAFHAGQERRDTSCFLRFYVGGRAQASSTLGYPDPSGAVLFPSTGIPSSLLLMSILCPKSYRVLDSEV